ncbi:Clp protease N-terminal domain-containing protein, partial [Burkholderia territorii]|uniref:Clp protease N-terminal domain-containing protein n=1 Tax=Burkholderia territorii TaxID=1503055 RepID=UPI000A6E9408
MTPRDTTHLLRRLNPHCAKALEAAVSLCQTRLADEITVEHWLLKLIQAGDGDIPAILLHYGINVDTVWDALIAAIEHLPRNLRGKPALSPQLATMLQDAWMYASSETDEATIRSGNLLQAIVDTPHVLRAQNAWPLLSVSSAQVQRLLPRLAHRSCESPMGEGAEAGTDDNATVPAGADTQEERARVATPPSTPAPQRTTEGDALARFAIDLTDKARRGDIDPVL